MLFRSYSPNGLGKDEQKEFSNTIKNLTGGLGANVVYDPVGGSYAEPAIRATAWDGRYLVIGFAAGEIPRPPLNLALLKNCQIVGVFWGAWTAMFPEENLNNFKSGNLNVLVSCTALDEGFDMPEADGAMILSASSSKRQRIQRMGRVLRITANKQNALIVTVYSSKTEYEKLREESNRYKLEGVPIKWQQMK